MATCEYEVQRQRKIAENRARMEQLGVQQLSRTLNATARANRPPQQPRVIRARSAADLSNLPARRSSRGQGKPAPNYNENALDGIDRVVNRKARQPFLGAVRGTSTEEVYTDEHLALLGDYKEPWELFVDGTDETGKRVYDKVNGMTCHQCRQKTLGKHTSCSCCSSLQGVLCGDCLFMRYGENILEVAFVDDWKCPVCRGLCNCSNHRLRQGWLPTGSLYRRAIAEGYRSVAHYLVLTKQASAAQPAVDKPAEAGVSQPAECPVETQAESASVEPPTSKLEGSGIEVQKASADNKCVKASRGNKTGVQQTLSSLLTQSKKGLLAGAGKSRKRMRADISCTAVGLHAFKPVTRSRLAVATS